MNVQGGAEWVCMVDEKHMGDVCGHKLPQVAKARQVASTNHQVGLAVFILAALRNCLA